MRHTKKRDEGTVRYYIFLTTRKGHSFVEPIGVISFEDYWTHCTRHEQGGTAGPSVPISHLDTTKLLRDDWERMTPFETFLSALDREGK